MSAEEILREIEALPWPSREEALAEIQGGGPGWQRDDVPYGLVHLGAWGNPEDAPLIESYFSDELPEVRKFALLARFYMGDNAIVEILRKRKEEETDSEILWLIEMLLIHVNSPRTIGEALPHEGDFPLVKAAIHLRTKCQEHNAAQS